MDEARRSRRGRRLTRAGCYLGGVTCGAALLTVLAPAGPGHAPAASAAVRAKAAPLAVSVQPGTPRLANTLFREDFEYGQGTTPVRLSDYAGASGQTYTADQAWLQDCNGWIAAFDDPAGAKAAAARQVKDCQPKAGAPGATGEAAWNDVRSLAHALGVLNGSPDPDANHAVSAYTNGPVNSGNPGASKVEFQTVNPISIPPGGKFLTVSANLAEMNCVANKNHAKLSFYLVNGTTTTPVTSKPIDPCANGGTLVAPGILAGTSTGDAPALFTGTSLGIQMVNGQGSGDGNDHAFDDIALLDVTPRLDKSFSPATAQVGGTSTLTFTITNTDDLLAKKGWSFTDSLSSGLTLATPSAAATTCPAGTVTAPDGGTSVSVAGGALNASQASCTVTVKVTSATAGPYINNATNITASTGLNPPGSSTVTFTNTPAIDLVKSVSPSTFSAAGQTLTYSFLVTNPSTVALSGITVNDTGLQGLSDIACPQGTLAAGASETCTATYTTTSTDLAVGSISNTATATGTPPTGSAVTSDQSTVTVPSDTGTLTLVKSATPKSFTASGQLIAFDFLVTNNGDVTLSSVTVDDTALPGLSMIICPQSQLVPGQSEHCLATYTTTPADVDLSRVTNIATAQGDPPGSTVPVMSDESAVTVPAAQSPAITLVKSASPATVSRAGQAITYSYLVTNTGNVTLTSVGITDHLRGLSAVTCPGTTLAAGASEVCTARYVTTAANLRAGKVSNVAIAQGDPPGSMEPDVSRPSTATVLTVRSAIALHKSASPAFYSRAGQVIHYRYRVTNSGKVTLSHATVKDTLRGLSAVHCPGTTLAPGASMTCTATYAITSADMKAGHVTNRAIAEGAAPGAHHPVISPLSAVTIHELVPVTG